MNILALDTSGGVLSAALSAESGTWYSEIDAGSRHSELLMECADGLCKSAGVSPGAIDKVACMKGPGSFTGLRIGFSAAKGISLALGIPLAAFSTLDCLAWPLSVWPGIVLPVIDAKKGCFFAAFYRGGKRTGEYLDASPELLAETLKKLPFFSSDEPIILTGSGADALYPRLSPYFSPDSVKVYPRFKRGAAGELLELCKNSIFDYTEDPDSGPDYLRKSDAELNWR